MNGPQPVWRTGVALEGWTVPALLAARAQEAPDAMAIGAWSPEAGITQHTWSQLGERVGHVALGLAAMGLAPGERVALMGQPSVEYVVGEHASWMAGAVSVGIYQTSSVEEIEHQLQDSAASVVLAEAGESLARVCAAVRRLEHPPSVITIGGDADAGPAATSLRDLESQGRRVASARPQAATDLLGRVEPESALCIIYTSGTTGAPKGVVHTHRSFLSATDGLVVPALPELRSRDQRIVAHMPLAHVVGKLLTITLPLLSRVVPYTTPDARDHTDAFRAIAPTYVLQPPRFLSRSAARVLADVESGRAVRRASFDVAMRVAQRAVARRRTGARGPGSWGLELLWSGARTLVFRPLLRKIGYHDVRWAQTGSALVPDDLVALWQQWGVDLRVVYGLSESAGHVTAQQESFPRPGDVGEPLRRDGWQVKLSPEGEVLFRGPSLFREYWRDPDATHGALVDGWLRTGDIGQWSADGKLMIVDRKKDILITSGGKSLSPQHLELALKTSPYIAEAVVVGEARKYVSALVQLDEDAVGRWASEHELASGSYDVLVGLEPVRALVEREIATANEALSRAEQIKRFAILPTRLDDEDGLLTATRKVRRRQVEERFRPLVEALYDSSEESAIRTHLHGAAPPASAPRTSPT